MPGGLLTRVKLLNQQIEVETFKICSMIFKFAVKIHLVLVAHTSDSI